MGPRSNTKNPLRNVRERMRYRRKQAAKYPPEVAAQLLAEQYVVVDVEQARVSRFLKRDP